MTSDGWKEALDQALNVGVPRVQFTGGEVTMHPDAPGLVNHALTLGLKVEVYSNLVHVTEEWWSLLRCEGVTLATSYYSDHPAEHNAMTGRPSHARTRENIGNAVQLGIPLRVGLIVGDDAQRAVEAEQELRALGVTSIRRDHVRPFGRGANGAAPDMGGLCGRCGDGRAAIGPSGEVSPCVFSTAWTVGNVQAATLADILGGAAMVSAQVSIRSARTHGTKPCTPDTDDECSPGTPGPRRTEGHMSTDSPVSEVRALIREHTGPVAGFERTARGSTSDVTAIVDSENGRFFVKAVRNRPGGRRDSITREKLINPFVWPISPALRWSVEDESWIVLGFEAVEGRSSDFRPDSADLSSVVELMECIRRLKLPPVAEDWPENRWDPFVRDESEAELFRGGTLLHTDINPNNFLVGTIGMWAVDWAWPTRGAAFIDPAILVVQLVAAGHSPESAESWAGRCKAWAEAEPKAVDTFAAAQLRLYRAALGRKPDQPWLHAMVAAAQSWADHRGVKLD